MTDRPEASREEADPAHSVELPEAAVAAASTQTVGVGDAGDSEPEDSPDLDEGWSSGPLPVPSSLPEGAVLAERPAPRTDRGRLTSARSKARKAAVELLFEAEQRGMNASTLLESRLENPTTQTPLREYTVTVMRGVVSNWAEIDDTISTYSRGWRLDRMPAVDRAILRVGTWEILYNTDVPGAVAVSEAVVLATVLSTDESPNFINGLLSRIVDVAP